MGRTDFSDQFRNEIIRHKCIGYNLNVMRQSTCLVINPITVDNFAALFNYRRSIDDLLLLVLFGSPGISNCHATRLYLLSPRFCFFTVLKRDLFVYRDDSLTSWRVIMRTEQPSICFVPL